MKLVFQCAIGIFYLVIIVGAQWETEEDDSCQTPTGAQGSCIQIRSCKYIIDLLSSAPRPLPPSTVQLLQRHGCGFDGNSPKVCCPAEQPVIPPVTVPTTSNREGPPDVSNHANLGLVNAPNCGPITIDRIYGGNKTAPFEYPWMALIAYNTRTGLAFRCGGTLINEYYVLTAAHCITELQAPTTLAGVRIGEHDVNKEIDCDIQNPDDCAPAVQDFTIAEVIPHPQYNSQKLVNDIGLLRLSGPANMESEAVRPICLPLGSLNNEILEGKNVIVAGWGATETGYASPDLLQVKIPVITLEECRRRYNLAKVQVNIGVQQLCAGGKGADSCPGDSGGPLKYASSFGRDNKFVQYGIVSFGPKFCGLVNQPGVYTRVAYYMDWILDNIKP